MRLRPVSLALLAVLGFSGVLHAQALPPPRVLPRAVSPPPVNMAPPGVVVPVMPPAGPLPSLPLAASPYLPPGYQVSAYQVWQNYGLSYQGWLLPRVIQTPQGGYFFYNGAPYPYVYVNSSYNIGSMVPSSMPAR